MSIKQHERCIRYVMIAERATARAKHNIEMSNNTIFEKLQVMYAKRAERYNRLMAYCLERYDRCLKEIINDQVLFA